MESFTDLAGNIPATKDGDRIALIKAGANFMQQDASKRPILALHTKISTDGKAHKTE